MEIKGRCDPNRLEGKKEDENNGGHVIYAFVKS